jgi:hypothetical protein
MSRTTIEPSSLSRFGRDGRVLRRSWQLATSTGFLLMTRGRLLDFSSTPKHAGVYPTRITLRAAKAGK